MADVACYTSFTYAYLARARVLAETVRRLHPDWSLWAVVTDLPPAGLPADALAPFHHVLDAADLSIPEFRRWLFRHDVVEACTAVKGAMLLHLLEAGARRVIYLDPDIAVFAPLDPVIALLDQADVVLTPHLLTPETSAAGVLDNEIGALKHGIYNLGFLGVAATDEGWRFARWWHDRLAAHCVDDIAAGLFTDQRWCDHVPVFFPGTRLLRDPGCNAASWNLASRPLSIGQDGLIRAAGVPLRFFHFTKFTGVGRTMLERHGGEDTALHELMAWYGATLAAKAPAGLPRGWWAYGHYADGAPIPRTHRRRWRADPALRARIADPFALTGDEFTALAGNA